MSPLQRVHSSRWCSLAVEPRLAAEHPGLTGAPQSASHVAVALIAATFVGVIATACWINFVNPRPVDFLSYWAAGHLAVEGRGAAAYDVAAHRSVEMSIAPLRGLIPFPYPPPFLLFVTPFGALPYGVAFAAWTLVTALLYAAAASKHFRPSFAFAHPCVVSNGLVGQNGFLTSAIFLFGTKWLDSKPLLAGAVLGLMVVKPQLGVLLPIALIAGRFWQVFAAAAASSILLLAAALLAFGVEPYAGFVDIVPRYADFITSGRWPWNELASPFAFLRYWGVPASAALAVHTAIAMFAATIVWRAWRLRWAQRLPILAAATILIPPYLFSYDALLLVLPLAALAADPRRGWLAPAVWALSALPIASNFGWFEGPNTLPLAALVLLICLSATATRPPRLSSAVTAKPEREPKSEGRGAEPTHPISGR